MGIEEGAVGVLAGVVAAALYGLFVFILKTVWKSRVEPWWENRLYGDARIDGEWKSTLHAMETDPDSELIQVQQTGHKIEGQIKCTSGPDLGRSYAFMGSFKNQILSGYYWNTDRTSIDSGSFSLRLEGDGSILKGHSVYYHDTTHALVSREYTWRRDRVPVGSSAIENPNPSLSGVAPSPAEASEDVSS